MEKTSNSNLNLFLETKFNKKIDNINVDDLKQITVLSLNFINVLGFKERFDFNLLDLFPNVVELVLYSFILSNEDLEKIGSKNYKSIMFNKCGFNEEYLSCLSNIEEMSFNNCYFESFSFFKDFSNLKSLSINNPYTKSQIDISYFINNKLEKIVLQNCIVKNISLLSQFKDCSYLSLLWSDLDDESLNFINGLSKLSELFISSTYQNNQFINAIKGKVTIKHDLIDYTFLNEEEA